MTVRDAILEIFERNKGKTLSGEELAQSLDVSRASVWKAVHSLREDGYPIFASTNRGYTFMENDILSPAGIGAFLQGEWHLHVMDSVDSTNTEVRRLAQGGAPDRTVVAAEMQTGGKGRRGKTFYSPPGTGLYFSLLLRPKMTLTDATQVTCRVAVAVARAVQEYTPEPVQIKWVNDIYIEGKKICGILSEAASDLESGNVEFIVVGIGINVATRDFPEELKAIAASIPGNLNRNQLLAAVLNELDKALTEDCMEEYKKRSCVLGRQIEIIYADRKESAWAVDIDREGRLIIRDTFGNLKLLCSGEISIKIS